MFNVTTSIGSKEQLLQNTQCTSQEKWGNCNKTGWIVTVVRSESIEKGNKKEGHE